VDIIFILIVLVNIRKLKYFALYAKKVLLIFIKWNKFMILRFKLCKFQKNYKMSKLQFYAMIVKKKVKLNFIFILNVLNVDRIIQQNHEIFLNL